MKLTFQQLTKATVSILAGILLGSHVSAKDITLWPKDSLDRAREAAHTGDRIILHGGVYRLDKTLVLGPQNSGVTWIAFRNEKPIISGGIVVTGWTADVNGRFKAKVNLDNFRQLWVNGQRAPRARGAVPTGLKFWGELQATVKLGTNPPGLSGTPGYLPGTLDTIAPAGYTTTDGKLADWKNPGDIEFGYYNSWTHMIVKIETITRTPDGARITMSQPGFFLSSRKGGTQAGTPAYMENALELLDTPGDWYFDRPAHTLYYLPRAGEDMSKSEVIAPKLETILAVNGAHDLRFQGLTFAHATWLRPSTAMGHPDLQANFIQPADNSYFRPENERGWVPVNGEAAKSSANVVVDGGRGVRFDGCTFTALGGAGLDLQDGAQNNVVSGCRFYDISGSGIQVGDVTREDHHPSDPRRIVKDNQVIDNVITHIGVEYSDAAGVFAGYTEGTVIAHNEIFDIPYSGISMGWGWGMPDAGGGAYACSVIYQTPTAARNNRIEFNHIHDLMRMRNDGGAIYMLSRQPGTVIRGNHIHDSGPGGPGGIYLDEGSADITVSGNLVYRVGNPLNFNNHAQNRVATCPVHDNILSAPIDTVPGRKGRALRAGSAIDVPIDSDLPQFTITAWIRLDRYPIGSDARRWIVCQEGNEWVDRNVSLFVDGKNVSGYLNIGGGNSKENWYEAAGAGDTLPLSQWTEDALTYDGDTLRAYCAGKETSAKKIGKVRTPGKSPLTIGARSDRFCTFDCGAIDKVCVYDRALAPSELDPEVKVKEGLVREVGFETKPMPDQAAKIAAEAGLELQFRGLLNTGAHH